MWISACYVFGNLRGTWSNEYIRFMTKSKSIYEKLSQNALQACCGNNEKRFGVHAVF